MLVAFFSEAEAASAKHKPNLLFAFSNLGQTFLGLTE